MTYDVIVVGAGHAGCEAASAAARMGAKTLLLTANLETIAWMSCNPAIGGQAKGQIVCEIDALGGLIGEITDRTGINFRVLNTRKGPAMHTRRAQCDRTLYHREMKARLFTTPNLSLRQDTVRHLLIDNKTVSGVVGEISGELRAGAVVLTCGTFLNGIIHIGDSSFGAGRAAEPRVEELSNSLAERGISIIRLKTGTPPRVSGASIDFTAMTPQPGDNPIVPFSRRTVTLPLPQVNCYLTHTNEKTSRVIRDNITRSAMYSGKIKSVGPRYCPSIEDKIVRFPDKQSHHVFLEPEDGCCNEYYVNGVSTSLPADVQQDFIRTIPGLEKAHLSRYAYAIEYDAFDPLLLYPTLESKLIKRLFLAGQINGTSGYEEAAGMGIIAGINAALSVDNRHITLSRHESYIGVMIDDLVSKGISEPYRMFTSRAENRLHLRCDNADERLLAKGHDLGLIKPEEYETFRGDQALAIQIADYLKRNSHQSTRQDRMPARLDALIRQHLLTPDQLMEILPPELRQKKIIEKVWTVIYYDGYVRRQQQDISRIEHYDHLSLTMIDDYSRITGLRKEVSLKLATYRPDTIAKARMLEGVNPADVLLLINYCVKEKE